MDSTMAVGDGDGEPDAGALQNKIDSLKFELRMANTDKKKLGEERDSLAAKNLALKEDAVRSERTKNEAREETANMRTQMRYMQVRPHQIPHQVFPQHVFMSPHRSFLSQCGCE